MHGRASTAEQLARCREEAQRHVREAIPRLERQRALVDRMHEQGLDTRLAEDLLLAMDDTMACFSQHLQRRTSDRRSPLTCEVSALAGLLQEAHQVTLGRRQAEDRPRTADR